MTSLLRNTIIVFWLIMIPACNGSNNESIEGNDPSKLHRSMKEITDIIVHDIFSPPVASRIYAYTAVAGYEAARYEDNNFVTLVGQLHGLDEFPKPKNDLKYSFELAAVQAILKTGRALIFSESKLDEFHNQIIQEYRYLSDDVLERSIAFGNQIADHVIQWSSKDKYKETRSFPKYSIDQSESKWKPTPPAYMDAVEPHWNKLRTFIIDSASEFRVPPPPDFSKEKNSPFYRCAYEVYETGKNLTDEQQQIARFWDCNPFVMNVKGHVMFATKKISPGGHWMNITRVACETSHADFVHSAEAYTRTAIALADGFIACWDEKYRSLLIRPESYINLYIDENWAPLLQTPPFPEYISGHSVISSAAASALTGVFGDNFAFTDSTEVEYGMTARSFKSFYQASEEAALSRLFGGIHYRAANEKGVDMGRAVGAFINTRLRTRKTSQVVS